jgi:dynein heavy chain
MDMEMDPEQIGEDPMEDMVEGMEGDYGEEDMEQINEEQQYVDENEVGFGDLKALFKADENKGKDHVAEARKANYISKGTHIWQLLNQIETGEQAISFFAKYGSSTPIKFVKCCRKPVTGAEFRPYDLIKVEDEDVDNPKSQEGEYFTISAQGVVHVHPLIKKGAGTEQVPSEFFTLAKWMHESTLYNVLTSMDFFKYYLIGKVFRLWKGNVRYKTYNRTRQQLSKALI